MDRYEFPNKAGKAPVRDIDFAQATRLCASRGKRLPSHLEFMAACGGIKKDLYVYGAQYLPGRCRSGLEWGDGPAPAGSYPECVRDGIYDLNGNVWEWVSGTGDPIVYIAYIAGGAWNVGPDHANCSDPKRFINIILAPSVGVRCVMTPGK